GWVGNGSGNCASRRRGWRVAPVSEMIASGASANCALRSF
ncbi:hypothetical protein A2U01_0112234, partial [Trifolium medium]|nr:hypothetical protein [Trifolium medium]